MTWPPWAVGSSRYALELAFIILGGYAGFDDPPASSRGRRRPGAGGAGRPQVPQLRHDDRGTALRRRDHRERCRRRHPRLEARPVGQAHPAARAGRLPAARAGQLGHRRGVLPGQVPHDERWRDRRRRRSSPRSRTTTWAATRSSTAPPCSGCGPRTSARSSTTGACSPAWPLAYADFEPWYSEAERLYVVHGQDGEDPTDGPRSGPLPVPARRARAPHPAAPRRPRAPGTPPRRTCRSASCSTRTSTETPPHQSVHPLRPGGRVPVPRRRQGRRPDRVRRPRPRPRQPRPGDQRPRRPAGDRRVRAPGDRGASPRSPTAPRRASPAISSSCPVAP